MSNDKKTVLVIGPVPPGLVGGVASFVEYQLSSTALHERFRVISLDTSLNPLLRFGGAMRFLGSLMLSFRLLGLLITRRPEIVHIHTSSFMSFWEKCFMMMLCRLLRRKTILHVHGAQFDSFYRNNPFKVMMRFFLNRVDVVIVLTSYWKNFFGTITRARLAVVPNCPREVFFEDCGNPAAGRSVVFTGDVGPRKGADTLLEAAALLRSRGVDNPVILAGSEEQPGGLKEYKRMIAERGIKGVEFPGGVTPPQLMELLKGAALFCLPSTAEGLPIAMLEAMGMGLPLVSTPVGGIPDALEDGVNGFIVPVGESALLADRLEMLLRDPGLRTRIGQANLEKSRASYHPAVTARVLSELYDSLAG